VPADAFEKSRLFHSWSEGTRFVLTKCRRSDQQHFDFYSSPDLSLAAARERYPTQKRLGDWNICLSNVKRRRINLETQKKAAEGQPETVRIEHPEGAFDCFVGTKLVGCTNSYPGIVNGAFLSVLALSPQITLVDEEMNHEIRLTPQQLARHCKLRHALTLTSCQGRTLRGTIALHDSSSRHFSLTHLYVGLSRATNGKNVWIV